MKIHNLIQGSPEWLAYRAQHFNASNAPAMMGCSPYKTRGQLMHELHTGLTPDVDAGTQRRFDDGHRFEALARPLAEAIIGEELYPVVGSLGKFSASFDGLTMLEETAFEHKSLNDELRACMNDEGNGYGLPLMYQMQMEQQLMVSGAERVLFMASKWNDDDELVEERHCWYASDPKLRADIRAGWAQFAIDLAAYTPPAVVIEAVGRAPETLPALHIEVTGMVTASNIAEFKATALGAIKSVNRDLQTDQDFADNAKAIKWCADIESRVKAAKEHTLGQTATIDAVFRAMDEISSEARNVRLELEKLDKARKDAVRLEIVQAGRAALAEHVAALNARLGKPYMPAVQADFAGVIKGGRTVSSIQDAVDTELARAKIANSEFADRIQANLSTLCELAAEHTFLFADVNVIVLKQPDDLTMLVKGRIAEHQLKEAARIEAETVRIRAEVEQQERAKAEQAARAQAEAEAQVRRKAEAAERARLVEESSIKAEVAAAELKSAQALPGDAELSPAAQALNEQEGARRFAAAHPLVVASAPNVVAMPVRAAAPADTGATMKLGEVNARLAPIALTAEGLASLGFTPVATDKNAKLYRVADLGLICAALLKHVGQVQAKLAA